MHDEKKRIEKIRENIVIGKIYHQAEVLDVYPHEQGIYRVKYLFRFSDGETIEKDHAIRTFYQYHMYTESWK